ncbi:MAG: 4-hydroxybenzoate octaprenyltransferase [Ignavibacteriaceae bacterium]|nr:4-hydroxybenzoate octaprenyltransferase [Ignavibacteriaceae bacterium]WKZ73857.1 MAG: geranylgeranylglycerol-phosphate geranylgeranyltransferase [Ignavibacteriaceae bacterium]
MFRCFLNLIFLIFKRLSLLALTRPINFIITFISGFLAVLIAQNGIINATTLVFGFLIGGSAAFVAAGGNIVNDIIDLETDKINRPDRPLPSGKVSVKTATKMYIFAKIFGFFFASLVGILPAIIAVLTSSLIFLYSFLLKKIPLVGNLTVAFFTGLVFIFGASAVGNYSHAIFPFLFAFTINLIREIVKDVEDIEGDRATGVKSLPVVFGIEKTKNIAVQISVTLIIMVFLPFFFKVYKIEYLVIIALSVAPALVSVIKEIRSATEKKNWGVISRNLKFIMILGIFAILMGI